MVTEGYFSLEHLVFNIFSVKFVCLVHAGVNCRDCGVTENSCAPENFVAGKLMCLSSAEGLLVDAQVRQVWLVPALHSSRQGVRCLEAPLPRVRGRLGLADPQRGRRCPWDPARTQHGGRGAPGEATGKVPQENNLGENCTS